MKKWEYRTAHGKYGKDGLAKIEDGTEEGSSYTNANAYLKYMGSAGWELAGMTATREGLFREVLIMVFIREKE